MKKDCSKNNPEFTMEAIKLGRIQVPGVHTKKQNNIEDHMKALKGK